MIGGQVSSGVWDQINFDDEENLFANNRLLGPIIGIDLGTSNSCVSLWHPVKNRAKVVKNIVSKKRTTPSTVVFEGTDFDFCKVGLTAEDTTLQVISGCKLLMGLEVSDLVPQKEGSDESDCDLDPHDGGVQHGIPTDLTLDVRSGHILIQCSNICGVKRSISPEDISAEILGALKMSAEEYLNRRPIKDSLCGGVYSSIVRRSKGNQNKSEHFKAEHSKDTDGSDDVGDDEGWDGIIRRAVIGVPANCSEKKKEATRRAARTAGFEEVHFMSESTAAAMAYGLLVVGSKNVLIFDMGGGTSDVTIMRIEEGCYQVQSTGGSSSCGGLHIDSLLLSLLLHKLELSGKGFRDSEEEEHPSQSPPSPLRCSPVKGYLRTQLLMISRKAKEKFSDLTAGSDSDVLTITIPTQLVRASKYVRMKKVEDRESEPDSSTPSTTLSSSPWLDLDEELDREGDWTIEVSTAEFEIAIFPVLETVELVVSRTLQQWNLQSKVRATDKSKFCAISPTGSKDSNCVPLDVTSQSPRQEMNEVVLVGGSSRSPAVRAALRRALAKEGFLEYAMPSHSSSPSPSTPHSQAGQSVEQEEHSDLSLSSFSDIFTGKTPRNSDGTQEMVRSIHRTRAAHVSGNKGEFCTAVDADHAVAQGLAIRAGILMGVDVGHLKDVLMMDMLPSSIGVLSWDATPPKGDSNGQTNVSGRTGSEVAVEVEDCRYFEPVLNKGDPIPSRGVKTFTLADRYQKVVSIDVYEEIEEVGPPLSQPLRLPPLLPAKEISREAASLSHSRAVTVTGIVTSPAQPVVVREVKFRYDLIGTYDFLVPEGIHDNDENEGKGVGEGRGSRKVDVVFSMSEEGALTFSVQAHQQKCLTACHTDTDSGRKGEGADLAGGKGSVGSRESGKMIYILALYLALMLTLYVVVKILIQSPDTRELIRSLSPASASSSSEL